VIEKSDLTRKKLGNIRKARKRKKIRSSYPKKEKRRVAGHGVGRTTKPGRSFTSSSALSEINIHHIEGRKITKSRETGAFQAKKEQKRVGQTLGEDWERSRRRKTGKRNQ